MSQDTGRKCHYACFSRVFRRQKNQQDAYPVSKTWQSRHIMMTKVKMCSFEMFKFWDEKYDSRIASPIACKEGRKT